MERLRVDVSAKPMSPLEISATDLLCDKGQSMVVCALLVVESGYIIRCDGFLATNSLVIRSLRVPASSRFPCFVLNLIACNLAVLFACLERFEPQ